jgi:NAD(P)-dependent dehydrogenase (short-subunit alcohol dehydrogenase family)
MDLELRDKVAVVTGGSKGIGLAIAEALLAEGATVVVGARGVAGMPQHDGLDALEVDLAAPDGPATLIAHAIERRGRVDILVNNVGGAPTRPAGFLSIGDADFEKTINLNFYAAVRAIRAVLPGMLERGDGAIVNVNSINAIIADPLVLDYSASKAALASVAKALSQELGSKGIRINEVWPGPVATDLWLGEHGVAAQVAAAGGAPDPAAVRAGAEAAMATGRFTTPQEVAAQVLLLASPLSGNVTGAHAVIDGGLTKAT